LPNYSKTLITINNTLSKIKHLTFVPETSMKRSQLKKSSAWRDQYDTIRYDRRD